MNNAADKQQLAQTLTPILTPSVLEHLPLSLQVEQTTEHVLAWMAERAGESDVYLVINKQTNALIGLMILVSDASSETALRVHLGYLISQLEWGKGYASELTKGLVHNAAKYAPLVLIGGVAIGNDASAHILRKNGFVRDPNQSDEETDVFSIMIAKS